MSFLQSVKDAFPEPERARSPVGVASASAQDTAYGMAALAGECEAVAGMAPNSGRDEALNLAAFRMGRLIASGHLTRGTAHANLYAAGRACGQTVAEVERALRDGGGLDAGQSSPRQVAERPATTNGLDLTSWTPPVVSSPGSSAPGTATNGVPPTAFSSPGTAPASGSSPAADVDTSCSEPSAEELVAAGHAARVSLELGLQRVRREAGRLLDAEEAFKGFRVPPSRFTLTDELTIPDEEITYTVSEVLPAGGNVLLTAQFKTGKTTLINSLAKSLADRTPFLDRFDVAHVDGRVALWNYEVDDRQYRRWLREVGITDTDRVAVLNLRGYRMPVNVRHVEDWIVAWLAERNVALWVVDPFARAFVGAGKSENDNTEVGAFLDCLDVIKNRAGVSDLILPTHTGRAEFEQGEERARGATRLDDWADVRWFLTKDENETRYFSATGRDVSVAEEKLTFDEDTRGYVFGGGDRAWEKRNRIEQAVITAVETEPGVSLRALRAGVRSHIKGASQEAIDNAIERAEGNRKIHVERGSNGSASRHFPAGHLPNGASS